MVCNIFFQCSFKDISPHQLGHCAQHECIHNTAFKTKSLNTVVSWLVSIPRLTNPAWEKMLHKDHHTYTNDPARDPEIMTGSPRNGIVDFFLPLDLNL